jgi:hypothetical protein
MALPTQLLVVLWSFFGLSVVAEGVLVYVIYIIFHGNDTDWQATTFTTLAQLATTGFVVCTLILLGHSTSALSVWRIFSVLTIVVSLLFSVASFRKSSRGPVEPLERAPILLATIVALFFAIASMSVRALPYIGSGFLNPTSAVSTPNAMNQLDFWHTALYVILTVACVTFGLLFITASVREGPLSFEKNWGGLGGSTGGWEVSNSLSYLIAAVAVGALLLSMIFHSDRLQQESEKRKQDEKAGTGNNQPGVSTNAAPSGIPGPLPAATVLDRNKAAAATRSVAHPGEHPDAH